MLTGQRMFGRETVSDTLAAVLTQEPDLDGAATAGARVRDAPASAVPGSQIRRHGCVTSARRACSWRAAASRTRRPTSCRVSPDGVRAPSSSSARCWSRWRPAPAGGWATAGRPLPRSGRSTRASPTRSARRTGRQLRPTASRSRTPAARAGRGTSTCSASAAATRCSWPATRRATNPRRPSRPTARRLRFTTRVAMAASSSLAPRVSRPGGSRISGSTRPGPPTASRSCSAPRKSMDPHSRSDERAVGRGRRGRHADEDLRRRRRPARVVALGSAHRVLGRRRRAARHQDDSRRRRSGRARAGRTRRSTGAPRGRRTGRRCISPAIGAGR